MTTPDNPESHDQPFDAEVANLLAARYGQADHGVENDKLELVARYLDGTLVGADADAALAVLDDDAELKAAFQLAATHRRQDTGQPKITSLADARARRRREAPKAWYGAIAAAAILAIGAVIFMTGDRPGSQRAGLGAGFGGAGAGDTMHVIVERDGQRTRLERAGQPQPGDRWLVETRTALPGFVSAAVVAPDGAVTPIGTDEALKATFDAGQPAVIPVPADAVRAGETGCLWIVAAVTNEPVDAAAFATAAKTMRFDAKTCVVRQVDATFSFARTVRALVIRRGR